MFGYVFCNEEWKYYLNSYENMQKWDRKRKKMIPFKLLEHNITTVREVISLIVDGITPEKWNYSLKICTTNI